MEVNRMIHHRVVDQDETDPLAELETDRLGLGELLAVEAPDESLHVAGQVECDLPRRRARIVASDSRPQVGISENATPGGVEADAWLAYAISGCHRDVIDLHASLKIGRAVGAFLLGHIRHSGHG